MRVNLSLLLAITPVIPAAAQLRSVDLAFTGIECASCLESLPARLHRMRGVESAKVDAAKQTLAIKLAAQNRVRLEQIRDAVEQDGTKAREAAITVEGTLGEEGGRWLLKLPAAAGASSQFEVVLDGAPPSAQYALKAGRASVTGTVKNLRPESGLMAIALASSEPVAE